ncbi:MAG TPA: hypothetical protein IAC25_06315 [Candidatus Enterenecus stercoripullorum]|nr:hypothetical protein [Candidatus Enterenecus stercoripullorum]
MLRRKEKEPAGPRWNRQAVAEGELRLLSAWEVLQARREGALLAQDGQERALCDNACLLARALERRGRPVYENGRQVLERLGVEDITRLAGEWAAFNRARNPSPQQSKEALDEAKKGWSTRLMSAFSGVCSACLALFPRRTGPGE